MIDRYVTERQQQVAPATVNRELALVKRVFAVAGASTASINMEVALLSRAFTLRDQGAPARPAPPPTGRPPARRREPHPPRLRPRGG